MYFYAERSLDLQIDPDGLMNVEEGRRQSCECMEVVFPEVADEAAKLGAWKLCDRWFGDLTSRF
jgi:hypothetical protein